MRFRSTWVFLLAVSACAPPLGSVRIAVVFENESRTQCIKASARNASGASVNASPANLPRQGKDSLVLGLSETPELMGELRVTISRFSSADCAGTAFGSETKTTSIVRGGATAMLEFRYSNDSGDGGADGGIDAGPRDGGNDAGCNTTACGNGPTSCEQGSALGCGADGGCRFAARPAQTSCEDGGACNATGTCFANACAVLNPGALCDDGLTCTTSSCSGGFCQAVCSGIPPCNVPAQPFSCSNMTSCALKADGDFNGCAPTPGGRCLDGGCVPWLALTPPLNFPSEMRDLPYPTSGMVVLSPDGGSCDTIIDTTGPNAMVTIPGCGAPSITSALNDAGVMVITTQSLDVGPAARLQFIGTRPVQLVVIGNANIQGIVSVAPLLGGQQPAGANLSACNAALPGNGNRQGGGGGGFGAAGGRGGEGGGLGGLASSMAIPLRGGCAGAAGFRPVSGTIPGGAGGGAIQLIVSDTLNMPGGTVTAAGGGGSPGLADNEGGGGGGSGGTVIIEARIIILVGGAVTANGGGGGEGGENLAMSAPGALGLLRSLSPPPAADGPSLGGIGGIGGADTGFTGGPGGASTGSRGGGGGGGAIGVVFIRSTTSCTQDGGIISGAQAISFSCP